MKNVKYIYRSAGEYTFRICLQEIKGSAYGILIRYLIQEPIDVPTNLWQRIKQTFTVETYHFGYWTPSVADDTLEERITWTVGYVAKYLDSQKKAKKAWEIV